jgi:hypothetical protein
MSSQRPDIPQRARRGETRDSTPSVILRGNTASGTRSVLARAVKLTQDEKTGRSTLSADLLATAALQARRQEPVEVVLVTADAHHSLLMPFPQGLILAAVVAEWETDPRFSLPKDLTVVAGVGGARDAIPEGEWLIVDPVRLRVTVAPDAGAIHRLQHKHRPRYRLGYEQETARTLTGVEVPVWARVFTHGDLQEAMENGADGIVIDGPGDFLPWDVPDHEPEDAALARLMPVAEASGGGDVALLAPFDAIDAASLVRLAAVCRLRLLLAPESLPLSVPELRAEFSAVADAEMDGGRLAAVPRFSGLLSNAPKADDGADPYEWRGFDETMFLPFDTTEIAALTLPDVLTVPPLWVIVSATDNDELAEAVSAAVFAGLRGVVVAPASVLSVKERIALEV